MRLLIPLAAGIVCSRYFPDVEVGNSGGWLLFAGCMALMVLHRLRLNPAYGAVLHGFLFLFGWLWMNLYGQRSDSHFPIEQAIYRIHIQEAPEAKERSFLCTSQVVSVYDGRALNPLSHPSNVLVYFPKDSASATLRRGDVLQVYTQLAPPVNNGNPFEFDYARYLRDRGIAATGYVAAGKWQRVGHEVARTFRQRAHDCRHQVVELYRRLGFSTDERAVLSALTVGAKDELSPSIAETYSVAGVSHVLALSGLHIGLIYALLWFLFAPLWQRWQSIKPLLLLVLLAVLWAYAFVTGLSSSVVRSVVMFSLLALGSFQYEKPLTLNTLAVTAFVMLLYRPSWLFDVGFQLSFVAVVAILVFQPRIYAIWRPSRRWLRYLWGLITVSMAAQLGTAPLVMLYFSRYSTHFLLANLWAVPMVTLVLYAALLLLVLTPFTVLQQGFAMVVKLLVGMLNAVLRWVENLPLASIDGISVQAWEVVFFEVWLLFLCFGRLRRLSHKWMASMALLMALVGGHVVCGYMYRPVPGITFYNVPGTPLVHCMDGSAKSWMLCTDSLPRARQKSRSLLPYWNRLHLAPVQWVNGPCADTHLYGDNQLYSFMGKRICIVNDDRWRHQSAIQPLQVHFLYIAKGYKDGIRNLLPNFRPQTVVVDAALSAYVRRRVVADCWDLGIDCRVLSETGALTYPI